MVVEVRQPARARRSQRRGFRGWPIPVPICRGVPGSLPGAEPESVDRWYMCIVGDQPLYSDADLLHPCGRDLSVHTAVHGIATRRGANGRVSLQLEDGSWVPVRSPDGKAIVTEVKLFDQWLVHVVPGLLQVHRGIETTSEVVARIRCGEAVCGSMSCLDNSGRLRMKLVGDVAGWTSLCGEDGVPYFKEASVVHKWYVNLHDDHEVHHSLERFSRHCRKVARGESVHGNFTVRCANGHLRLRLDDGCWTTLEKADGTVCLLESPSLDTVSIGI